MRQSRFFITVLLVITLILIGVAHASPVENIDDPIRLKDTSEYPPERVREMYLKAVRAHNAAALKNLLAGYSDLAKGAFLGDKTLLRVAIRAGNADIVTILLRNSTDDIDLRDSNGFTPLMAAAVWKNYDIVKVLVEHGADPDIQDNMGNTALFRAIFTKHNEILKLLIKSGADVNIKNASGETPLMMVKGTKQEQLMKQLLKERK